MLKIVTLLTLSLFSVSCAVVPVKKPHSARDSACGISTHEWDLKMVKAGGFSASCGSPECVLSVGLVAAATTGITAIVSGSIVVVGNVVHWVETHVGCDDKNMNKVVDEINTPLIQQGGKSIKTKQAMEKEFEEL